MHVEATTLGRLRRFELAPAQFFRLALLNVGMLWLIVVTGAAVRLTSSGLGCRHWPGCEKGHPLPAKDYHAYIEFGNRLIGGLTIVVTLLVALAATRAPSLPRGARRLALAVFFGTLAQAPLGYLAVKTDLRWPVVASHLLLSMVVLAGAVVLALEALAARIGRSEPFVPLELRRLGVFAAALPRAAGQRNARDGRGAALGWRRRARRPALAAASRSSTRMPSRSESSGSVSSSCSGIWPHAGRSGRACSGSGWLFSACS